MRNRQSRSPPTTHTAEWNGRNPNNSPFSQLVRYFVRETQPGRGRLRCDAVRARCGPGLAVQEHRAASDTQLEFGRRVRQTYQCRQR